MEREIFISYSRRNNKIVSKIKAEIETATGANCWMDLEGIESGSPEFDEVIVKGIMESKVFLFMLSKESQKSKYALNELDFASGENDEGADKKIVLINIDGCKMKPVFRFRYSRMDIIDWNDTAQHDKLIRDLKKWVGTNSQQGSLSKKPQPAFTPKATTIPKRQLVPTPKPIAIKSWVIGVAVAAVAIIMAAIGIMRGCDASAQQGDATDAVKDDTIVVADTLTPIELSTPFGHCTYEGERDEEGRPHGWGEAKFDDGSYYRGPFVHGAHSGTNAYYRSEDGDTFEGEFRDNEYYRGRYTIAEDSSYFYGTYKNGEPAQGKWYDKRGNEI